MNYNHYSNFLEKKKILQIHEVQQKQTACLYLNHYNHTREFKWPNVLHRMAFHIFTIIPTVRLYHRLLVHAFGNQRTQT